MNSLTRRKPKNANEQAEQNITASKVPPHPARRREREDKIARVIGRREGGEGDGTRSVPDGCLEGRAEDEAYL